MKIYADSGFQLIAFIWCRVSKQSTRSLAHLLDNLGFNANRTSIWQISQRYSSTTARQNWLANVSQTPPLALQREIPSGRREDTPVGFHVNTSDHLPATFEHWRRNPAFSILSLLLARTNGMSSHHVAQLWRALGVQISHQSLLDLIGGTTLAEARILWASEIAATIPQALSNKMVRTKPLPRVWSEKYAIHYLGKATYNRLLSLLEPSDISALRKKLSEKVGNARRDLHECTLDIVDMILMCITYREFTGDRQSLCVSSRYVDICRYRDEGAYSLDNSVFRPHGENGSYARHRKHMNNRSSNLHEVNRINTLISSQIRLQQEIREKHLIPSRRGHVKPDFLVLYCDDQIIVIADNHREPISPALDHGYDVIESLRHTHSLLDQHVFCHTESGSYLEMLYLAEGFVSIAPVSDSAGKVLTKLMRVYSFTRGNRG